MFRKLGSHVILKLLRVTVRRLSYAFALRWTHSEEGEGRQGAGQGAVRGAGSPQPLTRSQPQGGSDSWSLCPLPRCAAGLPATPAETSLFCRVLPARPGRGAKAAICKPGRGSWQGNATVSPGPWMSSLRNCEEQVTGKAVRGCRLRRGTHRSPRRPCSRRTPQAAFGRPWPTVIRILFVGVPRRDISVGVPGVPPSSPTTQVASHPPHDRAAPTMLLLWGQTSGRLSPSRRREGPSCPLGCPATPPDTWPRARDPLREREQVSARH